MKYLDETGLARLWAKVKALVSTKQDALVSGTNIKTINNQSVLGSGNISVSGGSELKAYENTVTVSIAANSTSGETSVTFPSGLFSETPVIQLTLVGGYTRYAGATLCFLSASTAGVTVRIYHTSSSTASRSFSVRLLALQI